MNLKSALAHLLKNVQRVIRFVKRKAYLFRDSKMAATGFLVRYRNLAIEIRRQLAEFRMKFANMPRL
jgi:hypothetical protein